MEIDLIETRAAPGLLAIPLLFAMSLVHAAEDAGADDAAEPVAEADAERYPEVSGNVSVGALATSGNTESESVNADAQVQLDYAVWRQSARATAYTASEGGATTGERYTASLQSDYKFSERSYLFANVRYMRDRFGAFERRTVASAGLGRRFVDTETVELDLEAGVGRREQEPADSGEETEETITRGYAGLRWAFSGNGRFSQTLEVESGDSNTYGESVSAVRSQLVGTLALRLSYTVQHNSDVPAETERTDTITAVSLEYDF